MAGRAGIVQALARSPCEFETGRDKPVPYQNTNMRTSQLSRGGVLASCVGRRNAVCAVNRARPSVAESYTLNSSASSGVMRGNQ